MRDCMRVCMCDCMRVCMCVENIFKNSLKKYCYIYLSVTLRTIYAV